MPATAVEPNEISIEFRGVTYGVNGTLTGRGLAARESQNTHREGTPKTHAAGTGQWDGAGGATHPASSGPTRSELRGLAADPRPTRNKSRPTLLLRDVSLSVRAGETLVLLGRSGSGKTTLLRLINRMLTPTAGNVLVRGRATIDWDPFALRRGIGYVIQEAGLFPHFTVAENIALVPTLEHWEATRVSARVQELLQLVGLRGGDFAQRYPRQLSGGQRQRVGVARALAADPDILLMDEPFGALDPVTRAELQREFQALALRLAKTIVFVTHDLREALLLASRIVLLQDGQIVAHDTPQNFLQLRHPEVRAFAASLQIASQNAIQSSLDSSSEGRARGEHP